jgi:hypothetical protein
MSREDRRKRQREKERLAIAAKEAGPLRSLMPEVASVPPVKNSNKPETPPILLFSRSAFVLNILIGLV